MARIEQQNLFCAPMGKADLDVLIEAKICKNLILRNYYL